MSDTGFFLLPRRWSEIPAVERRAGPFCARAAWIWLVERAAYADRTVVIGCRTVALKRGQLADSYRYLAETWGWSLGAVQRFLADLVADTEIICSADSGRLVITICNYEQMQQAERQPNPPPDAPRDTSLIRARYAFDTKDKQGKQREQRKQRKEDSPPTPRERGEEAGADLFGPSNPNPNQERPPPPPIRPPPSPRPRAAETDPVGFEAFWNAYPRREGKGQARAAYVKALRKIDARDASHAAAFILNAVVAYPFDVSRPRYIKLPSTWLNAECWLDEHDMEDPVLRAAGITSLRDVRPQGRS